MYQFPYTIPSNQMTPKKDRNHGKKLKGNKYNFFNLKINSYQI